MLEVDRSALRWAFPVGVALELGLPGVPGPALERLPRPGLERGKPFRLTALNPAHTTGPTAGSGRYGWACTLELEDARVSLGAFTVR